MKRRTDIAFLPGPAGERALVSRLLAGEDAAYRELYERYAPALMRLLLRMLRERALAEDILQETFVVGFRSIAGFRGDARLSTWLTSIATRRALNALRGESRRERLSAPGREPCRSPERDFVERELTEKVLAVLDEMGPDKKLALLLWTEGYSATEIAVILEQPRNTVLSRLERARAEFARRAAAAGLDRVGEWLGEEGA